MLGTWLWYRVQPDERQIQVHRAGARNITLPLLSPATFFVVAMALINALNVFDPIVVMTQGGPNDSTQTLVKYIVDNAVQFFQIGYASAIAAVTFLLVLALTLGQNGLQRVWVHYE